MKRVFLTALFLVLSQGSFSECPKHTQNLGNKNPSILNEIIEKTQKAVLDDKSAAVVFDLDDTLFDTRYRSKKIFQELAKEGSEFSKNYPDTATVLRAVSVEDIQYGVEETLTKLGIKSEEVIKKVKADWGDKFFSNEYVVYDRPIKGAQKFVQTLYKIGATIFYVTGREEKSMGEGSVKTLVKHKFPYGKKCKLFLKQKKEADTVFKKAVLTEVAKNYFVIASFENEPRNLEMMAEVFPNADMVLLDTKRASDLSEIKRPFSIIKNFAL